MITQIDPKDFSTASTVQVDSDAGNPWLALDEIETWAAQNGFVRTSEYHARQVLVSGRRLYRAVCYRISDEERAALEQAQSQMSKRAEALRGILPRSARGVG